MRRFEFSEGVSNKFWEVEQDGCDLHVCYGKAGTSGQRQTKTHPDQARAAAAMEKLIREKTGKGYVEAGNAAPTPPAAMPAPVPPAPMPAPAAAPPGVAPWLNIGALVDMPAEFAAQAMPSRRCPGPPRSIDADASWKRFRKNARSDFKLDPALCDPAYQEAAREAVARLATGERHGSQASDAILLAIETVTENQLDIGSATPFTDFLVADKGLPYALEVLLNMARAYIDDQRIGDQTVHAITPAVGLENYVLWSQMYSATELALRAHLARADADEWARCAQLIREAAPDLVPWRRPLLALLLPDVPDLANDIALSVQAPEGEAPAAWCSHYRWLFAYVTSAPAIKAMHRWSPAARSYIAYIYSSHCAVASVLQDRGSEAAAFLAEQNDYDASAEGLACIGTPQSMTALALACTGGYTSFERFCAAAQRWPQAALVALGELIGKDGCGPARAREALARLVATHANLVPSLESWLSAPAWKVLATAAAQFIAVRDFADTADLPPVLASPPWKVRSTAAAAPALALAPLALPPVERWSAEQRDELSKELRYAHYWGPATPLQSAAAAIEAGDAPAVIAAWLACTEAGQHVIDGAHAIAALPAPLNAQVWNALAATDINHPGCAIATLGIAALPGLVAMIERRPADNLAYALHFGAVELAAPVARAYAMPKPATMIASARGWLLRNPEHAACGLIGAALGGAGGAREQARQALRMLATAGHDGLLMDIAARYGQAEVSGAMRAMLDEDPLTLHPAKIGKLPAFWTPLGWTRPLLASTGKALPDASLDLIGTMLRFPHSDRVYAGVTQLKQACTPDSLADFSWELFRAWVEDDAKPKEDWAFYALGLLGNDDSARKLTPLLRAWPGEKLHARAVVGLDVLAMIGSDTALTLLNGIALKLRFKALQDKASEKIAAIAVSRDLSTEELEDRLAPDLDLDDKGEMQLDFGPRQFRVGFDEALKPYVRDQDGARLADLPKPKKTDDPELSASALERYKLLKTDARTIATQQVLRLERAMCAQRRWQPQVFRDLLAGHPLLRHLVQRLVWAAYGGDGGVPCCFRVAPDGTLTDAADDAFTLPAGEQVRIGIPHALDLPPADAARFGQLFADYELLQPFAQIGRDTHTLTADEAHGRQLRRWNGAVVPAGRLLGLVDQGWYRRIGGGGETHAFSTRLDARHMAELHIAPGLTAGLVSGDEEQTLHGLLVVRIGEGDGVADDVHLRALDPVVVSELIRGMEQLCA